MKILVMQGANQHLLGLRQPEIYGTTTAKELDAMIEAFAAKQKIEVEVFYTNSEAEMIDRTTAAMSDGTDAIVCNTGGFCYGSYAIRDCFASIKEKVPIIEIHMSNQLARGIHSVTAVGATAFLAGLGVDSYMVGILAAMRLAEARTKGA